MAIVGSASGQAGLLSRAASKTAAAAVRNVRTTVVVSFLLICGSFASAAALQLHFERGRAIHQAGQFETRRAQEIAADLSQTFERYAALGTAFANATGSVEASAALSDAGGNGLKNIVLLDRDGNAQSEMKGEPAGLLPLSPETLEMARLGRTVTGEASGRDLAILFPHEGSIIAVQIDARALLRPASMDEALLATRAGRILDLGSRWEETPSMEALSLPGDSGAVRIIGGDRGHRLVALAPVSGWPVVAGASVRVGEALSSWYASLPLFLFFILGPAIAGAALAVVFVREFERRARAADAIRSLKATPRDDARLLIRLADAERRAVEAERSKSEFVAHMSHELRTPLNAIIGFSEVIAQGTFGAPGHPKYLEYAGDIGAAGRHLHAKIGDILDFANLEAGRHPLTMTRIDISSIARAVLDELAGRAFSRRIRLTVSIAEEAPAMGDALAVKRILANLLTNALQYTPEGGAVRVAVRSEDGAVVAAISDTGLGFTPDEQKVAGYAFVRFDRPGAVTGVGMGLAIAMALARQMGAVLRLAAAQGQGTTAELRLPKA